MTEFKSTKRIKETIDTINSKLTNHKIKLDKQFIGKTISSMHNDKELIIFDVNDKTSGARLKMLEDLNTNIDLFKEKLNIIHGLNNASDDFRPVVTSSTDKLNITKIRSTSNHPLHPEEYEEYDDIWEIGQLAEFEINHKGNNKVDIHAVIETVNHDPESFKKIEKEITIKDMELDDIVTTIQELKEITLDDFRMTHTINGTTESIKKVKSSQEPQVSDLVLTDSDLDLGDTGMQR